MVILHACGMLLDFDTADNEEILFDTKYFLMPLMSYDRLNSNLQLKTKYVTR